VSPFRSTDSTRITSLQLASIAVMFALGRGQGLTDLVLGTAAINRRLNGAEMDIRGDLITVAKWWIDPAARRGAARPAVDSSARE